MAFTSNGQISYLVLDSLISGSKYGLEIIEFISQKTGGAFIMKKPTLYSCLTRMEKKGLVSSSYWGDSDLGGKRHYYTITAAGKTAHKELESEFEGNFAPNFQQAQDSTPASSLAQEATSENNQPATGEKLTFEELVNNKQEEPAKDSQQEENKPLFLQQENLFSMISTPKAAQEPVKDDEEESDVLENQIDIFAYQKEQETAENTAKEPVVEEEKTADDGKFLETTERLTEQEQQQNRMIFDTSSELKKYRKRKSFSENQIEMSVVYENQEDIEIQKARIEELKRSLLGLKQNNQKVEEQKTEQAPEKDIIFTQETFKSAPVLETEDFSNTASTEKSTTAEEAKKDDAVFITEPHFEQHQIPIQRKITPPNIDVSVYDNNLPAPKRNADLEPTYKDMMAKLFERKNDKPKQQEVVAEAAEEPENTGTFADYSSLKKYYGSHGISFNEYNKSTVSRKHNTNFLNMISSAILLVLSGISSAIFYAIISGTNNLRAGSNFLYYTLPLLFLSYFIFAAVRFKLYPSRRAFLLYNSFINWMVFALGTVIVVVINILCGMQAETMASYLTSLLLPIFSLLLAFPINLYVRKFLYHKYSK